MGRTFRRVAIGAVGGLLILAGIALGAVPLLPGFPLVIGGLLVLAREFTWAQNRVHAAREWAAERRGSHQTERDLF
jgi:hypothetical protein